MAAKGDQGGSRAGIKDELGGCGEEDIHNDTVMN